MWRRRPSHRNGKGEGGKAKGCRRATSGTSRTGEAANPHPRRRSQASATGFLLSCVDDPTAGDPRHRPHRMLVLVAWSVFHPIGSHK
ncbi:hypothetical protein GUJ93_ZPchr0012g20763 [Zizania palustris]|uniref:Uncharacterized protein n=1 Tax=Zizania palustris TaxID=103762 RepID=A0A8J5WNS6_ZIZPA|nr:hypothetical protein GUJ93_ZPchr0012g20763 [Zizania palustris]